MSERNARESAERNDTRLPAWGLVPRAGAARRHHDPLRRRFVAAALLLVFGVILASRGSEGARAEPIEDTAAQQAPTWRIGALFWHDSPNDELALEGFRAGLERHAHRYEIDVHNVHSDENEARRLLASWETSNVDLVLSLGTRATQLAKESLESTPIVYTAVTNPVLTGIADNWESSGPRIAGNSNWIPAETLLRAFSRAVPDLHDLGVLAGVDNPVSTAEIAEVEAAIAANPDLDIRLHKRRVHEVDELDDATRELVGRVDALWIPIDFLVYENLHLVRKSTDPAHLPLLSSSHRGAEAGAVVALVVDYKNLGRNAAAIAVRILEDGRDPASIPVGRLSGYRTIVNLAQSRAIGYRLPLDVLCTADRVLR